MVEIITKPIRHVVNVTDSGAEVVAVAVQGPSGVAVAHVHLLADVTDSGTMAAQDDSLVDINGGAIDGVVIGAAAAAAATFTTLNMESGSGVITLVGGHEIKDSPYGMNIDSDVGLVVNAGASGYVFAETGLMLVNGVEVNAFSGDGSLVGNSDLAVPTEKAVKTYVDTNAGIVKNHIKGFDMQSNASDPDYDIDISAGQCVDAAGSKYLSGMAMTKQMDTAWAAGTNAGGSFGGAPLPVGGTCHNHLIEKDSDGSVDYGWDDTIDGTGGNIPSGWTWRRRIGSFITVSGNILRFRQEGDRFLFDSHVTDYDSGAVSVVPSDALKAVAIPTGLKLYPILSASIQIISPSSGVTSSFGFAHADNTAGYHEVGSVIGNPTIGAYPSVYKAVDFIQANSNAQIYVKFKDSANDTRYIVRTNGWIDGRDE